MEDCLCVQDTERKKSISQEEERILALHVKRMQEAREKLHRARSPIKKAILRGQIKQGEIARQMLLDSLSAMCAHIARRFSGVYDVDFDDLYQSAKAAALLAIDNYDPAYGTPLHLYAWRPVQRDVARVLNSSGRGLRRPIRVVEKRAKIRRRIVVAWQNGVGTEEGEIAQAIGVKTDELSAVLHGDVVSLDEGSSNCSLKPTEIERWEEKEALQQAVRLLPNVLQRLVIGWRYELGEESLSVQEIARRIHTSPRVVRAIEREALQLLREIVTDTQTGWIW